MHSKLRMPAAQMTRRMLTAVTNPHVDVLGTGVAVEINSRPERLDPPRRLLRRALDAGCLLAIDSDAHAPGQLDWQGYGCDRAAACGVPAHRVVNTWSPEDLRSWAANHAVRLGDHE